MKKTFLMMLTLVLFIFSSLFAQSESDEAYIKAMTAPVAQKGQLLKEFITKFGGQGNQYEKFAYANLTLLPYQGKTAKETIDYGEKALTLGGLDDLTKCQVLLVLSGVYSEQGQNLDKSKSYATQVIELSRANKDKESATTTPEEWVKLSGAGLLALGKAQEKAKDPKAALESYINSYNVLKAQAIAGSIKTVAKTLYDFKFYPEAEKAFKLTYSILKDFDSISFLGKTLYRMGKKDEALTSFKEAYAKQKNGEIAFNIGILLAEKAATTPSLSSEAISYLVDASILYPAQSKQALDMAQSLYFTSSKDSKYNETVKQMKESLAVLDGLNKTFAQKFGNKSADELTDDEKRDLKRLQTQIDVEKQNLQDLQTQQTTILAGFSKVVEEAKKKLGKK